jgi:hypothetical protein
VEGKVPRYACILPEEGQGNLECLLTTEEIVMRGDEVELHLPDSFPLPHLRFGVVEKKIIPARHTSTGAIGYSMTPHLVVKRL